MEEKLLLLEASRTMRWMLLNEDMIKFSHFESLILPLGILPLRCGPSSFFYGSLTPSPFLQINSILSPNGWSWLGCIPMLKLCLNVAHITKEKECLNGLGLDLKIHHKGGFQHQGTYGCMLPSFLLINTFGVYFP